MDRRGFLKVLGVGVPAGLALPVVAGLALPEPEPLKRYWPGWTAPPAGQPLSWPDGDLTDEYRWRAYEAGRDYMERLNVEARSWTLEVEYAHAPGQDVTYGDLAKMQRGDGWSGWLESRSVHFDSWNGAMVRERYVGKGDVTPGDLRVLVPAGAHYALDSWMGDRV